MAIGPRRIGGQNLEGRFFIITIPAGWTENDPLPAPSPDDSWFDRLTEFKAALDCPWIRRPLRHTPWADGTRSTGVNYVARRDGLGRDILALAGPVD